MYVTGVIAVSLVVYVFFLRNSGANWLDDERGMRERSAPEPGPPRSGRTAEVSWPLPSFPRRRPRRAIVSPCACS